MSLIAWWPLNGNLKDYSGNKNNMTLYNNIAVDNDGKIGKTYLAKQENSGGSMITERPIELLGDFTWCLWVNPLGCGLPASDNSPNSGIMSNHDHPNTENFAMQLAVNDSTTYLLKIAVGYKDNTRPYVMQSTPIIPKGKWTHLAFTRKNNTLSIYINGVLNNTFTPTKEFKVAPEKFVLYRWAPSYTGNGGYTLYGRINDARVYNEALSLKEIKEIAKAKILHYKFDDMQEPTVNIEPNPTTFTSMRFQHGTHEVGTFYGRKCMKVTINHQGNGTQAWTGSYQSPAIALKAGQYATRSAWILLEPGWSGAHQLRMDPAHSPLISVSGNHYYDRSKAGTWQKLIGTGKAGASDIDARIYIYPFGKPANSTERTKLVFYVADPQLEIKDHATEFVNGSRTGEVKDCSGYDNHAGLDTNSPRWMKESKIGSGCYKFNGNSQAIILKSGDACTANPTEELTLSAWVKPTIHRGAGSPDIVLQKSANYYLTMNNNGTLSAYWYGKSPAGYHSTTEVLPLNTWSFIVASWSKTELKLYINGKCKKTIACTGIGVNNNGTVHVGGERHGNNIIRHFGGYIDDARIYATALSDEDVALMYSSKAAIAKDGTLFTNNIAVNSFYNETINGENLITNGFGELENNTNFPNMTYLSTDGVSSLRCFERAGALTFTTSEKIRINLSDTYEIGGWFKSVDPAKLSAYHIGMMCLDENGNHITHWEVHHYSNTRTTLAAPLNNGDTTVTLTSGANWQVGTVGVEHHTKHVGIYNRPEAPNYERTKMHAPYLSISGNVLTLKSPWSGGTIPAGTKVANNYSGSGYSYVLGSGAMPATWTLKKDTLTKNNFRFGTTHVRFLWLANYQQDSTYKIRGADIYLKNKTSHQVHPTKLKAEVHKSGTLKAKAISEVGITDHLIAYYNGKSYKDYSGNKSNITAYSSVPLATIEDGYKFTGTQGANIANILTPLRTNNKDFSIALNFTQSAAGGTQRLFMGHSQNYLELSISPSAANVGFSIRNTAYKGPSTANNSVVVGKKHFVVVTYKHSTQTASIYIDDKPGVSATGVEPFLSCDHLLLGNWTSGTQGFKGTIHDLKVFDKCLTPSEIAIEYKTTGLKQVLINKDGTVYANSFNEVLI